MSGKSLWVHPNLINHIEAAYTRSEYTSQKDLATDLGISRDTVSKFFNAKRISRLIFIEICKRLDLEWQDVADLNNADCSDILQETVELKSEENISSHIPNSEAIESEAATISENKPRGLYIPNTRCRYLWGRDELVNQVLSRLYNPQELSILSLSGSAGYGKTEVATQIAKTALKDNIFADVLWVTARQTELVDGRISEQNQYEVLNWNRFLHEIAGQLRCPVEGIRQRLKEEKLLIILDNAETADLESILSQLNQILNPSRALLTSRVKTKPPYVGLVPIKGLDPTSSCELLKDEAEYNNMPVLLQASDVQLERVHELSCGAPLALHFVVSSILNYNAIEPVLAGLEQAQGEVEQFYKFTLETAWQRINKVSQDVLRYMGQNDAGVTQAELSIFRGLSDLQLNTALSELRRWYLVEDTTDKKSNLRYDLHPWIRSCVRNGLVDNWQPSLQDLEQIAKSKFDI
ncbi:NB-ARC domain-containing protein [Nostoc sp. CALU 546]|uniref:NB-ARC domain-containing protein n=1 Tax=Nostoc sp. CALU 546 TaxID=1867241 RepID=UPI003B67A697